MEALVNVTDVNVTRDCIYDGNFTSEGPDFFLPVLDLLETCSLVSSLQDPLMQVAQLVLVLGFCLPPSKVGRGAMHAVLTIGHLIMSTWGWNVVSSRLVFAWSLGFVVINLGQTIHLLYLIRPHNTDAGLDTLYDKLFRPYNVERLAFRKLVSREHCTDATLHPGQAYAVSGRTPTDRLAVLVTGEVSAIRGQQYLHHVSPLEFLDSPEFESSKDNPDVFKVSLIARSDSRYLSWSRSTLEQVFLGDPHLATVISTLVAKDIVNKVAHMGYNVITGANKPTDLRVLSLTSAIDNQVPADTSEEKRPPSATPAILTKQLSLPPSMTELAGHFGTGRGGTPRSKTVYDKMTQEHSHIY